jgi:AcrR family transcriptional regulator
VGPRQARALATRERILDAAAHEFAAEGYHAASLSKILERSGVTRGAMYFHFASKEAMGRAVADVMAARLPEAVADRCLADGGYAAVRERAAAAWSVLLAGVAEPRVARGLARRRRDGDRARERGGGGG